MRKARPEGDTDIRLHTPLTTEECIARLRALEPRTLRQWRGGGVPMHVSVQGRVVRLRMAEVGRHASLTAELFPTADGTWIDGRFDDEGEALPELAGRMAVFLAMVGAAAFGAESALTRLGYLGFFGAAAFSAFAAVTALRLLHPRESSDRREMLEHVAPVLEATPTSPAAAKLLSRTNLVPSSTAEDGGCERSA